MRDSSATRRTSATNPNQTFNALWVTAPVAAASLGITTDQLYRAVRANRLQVRWLRIGALLRFSAVDLGLIEDQKEETQSQDKSLSAAA